MTADAYRPALLVNALSLNPSRR